jgi:hypothetical protein
MRKHLWNFNGKQPNDYRKLLAPCLVQTHSEWDDPLIQQNGACNTVLKNLTAQKVCLDTKNPQVSK